jgi:hypothetical protein
LERETVSQYREERLPTTQTDPVVVARIYYTNLNSNSAKIEVKKIVKCHFGFTDDTIAYIVLRYFGRGGIEWAIPMRKECSGHESWWMNVEEVSTEHEHHQADDIAPPIDT